YFFEINHFRQDFILPVSTVSHLNRQFNRFTIKTTARLITINKKADRTITNQSAVSSNSNEKIIISLN
ncbi:MAG: hypothetical protein IIZ03_08755, partial [Succinivibrionaceae bacterium]|nr:hypothetical protein [Succinivibrionaceae bacterium]